MRSKIIILIAGFLVSSSCIVLAEVTNSADTDLSDPQSRGTFSIAGYQKEVTSDQAGIQAEREIIKEDVSTDRQEDRQLYEQIQAAQKAGDTTTVDQLKEQLKSTNEADAKELRQARKALRSDRQERRHDLREEHRDYRHFRHESWGRDLYRHENRDYRQERQDRYQGGPGQYRHQGGQGMGQSRSFGPMMGKGPVGGPGIRR